MRVYVRNNEVNLLMNEKIKGDKFGIVLIESKVFVMCCSFVDEDGESMEGGKVIMVIVFEIISIFFSNFMKESMFDFCV